MDIDVRVEMIRALIPVGLIKVYEELDREVERLDGALHSCKETLGLDSRHGSNRGTVKIGGQNIPVSVPSIRKGDDEAPLESYRRLHRGEEPNEVLLRRVLYGIYRAGTTRRRQRVSVERSDYRALRSRGNLSKRALRSCADFGRRTCHHMILP